METNDKIFQFSLKFQVQLMVFFWDDKSNLWLSYIFGNTFTYKFSSNGLKNFKKGLKMKTKDKIFQFSLNLKSNLWLSYIFGIIPYI